MVTVFRYYKYSTVQYPAPGNTVIYYTPPCPGPGLQRARGGPFFKKDPKFLSLILASLTLRKIENEDCPAADHCHAGARRAARNRPADRARRGLARHRRLPGVDHAGARLRRQADPCGGAGAGAARRLRSCVSALWPTLVQ